MRTTYAEVVPLAEFIRNEKLVNGHFFEVVRGDPPDVRIRAVPPEALRRIYDKVLPFRPNTWGRACEACAGCGACGARSKDWAG